MGFGDVILYLAAGIFVVTPAFYAVMIDHQLRAFERESFGLFRSGSRLLRVAVWVVLAYDLAIVASGFIAGELSAMVQWPLSRDGAVMYVKLAAVALGFFIHWLVSLEFYRIVTPLVDAEKEKRAAQEPFESGSD